MKLLSHISYSVVYVYNIYFVHNDTHTNASSSYIGVLVSFCLFYV